jgi:transcriptional regulator with XRE-family HTH domain
MTPVAYRAALVTLGWSQRELASRLGVSHNTTYRYAKGERQIPPGIALWLESLARLVASHPPPHQPDSDPED